MDMLHIRQAVFDLWTFTFPPILLVAALSIMTRRLFPESLNTLFAWQQQHIHDTHKKNRLRTFMNSIGASKLYPAALAVIVVLIVHLINEFILFCQYLPPSISFRPSAVARGLFSYTDLWCLHSIYPDANGFDEAYYAASREVSEHTSRSARYDFYYAIQNVSKAIVAIICVLTLWLLAIGKARLRAVRGFVVASAVAMAIWCLCLVPILAELNNDLIRETESVLATVRKTARDNGHDAVHSDSSLPSSLVNHPKHPNWWWINFGITDKLPWFIETFITSKLADQS